MVQVPRVQDNSVRQAALPGARVNATQPLSAFGGGDAMQRTSDAARGFGKEAIDLAMREKQSADEVRIQEADLELSKAQTDIVLKSKEMLGKNAFGAPDFATSEWKKKAEKIRAGLTGENQKASFDKIHSVRSADLYSSVQSHVSVESKKYDAEVTDSYLKNAQNIAAMNFTDVAPGGQVEQSLYLQEEALKKYANRNGIPQELLDNKILSTRSNTHTAVINQMLANNMDQAATEYYKEKKDAILPEERIKIDKSIEQAALLGEGQRQADQIFPKYADNRNAAFEYIKNHVKDPELRKQTEEQIDRMYVRQGLAQRADNQKNYQLASQLVEGNQKVPGNISSMLTAEQNAALQRRLKQVNAGVQPNTDWATYYNLKTMAAGQKNDFIKENLLEYRHVLSDQEFKDLTNLQTSLSKNDPGAHVELNGFRTSTQIINDTLMSAGINVKSKRPEDQKRVAQFRREVDEHLQIIQDQTGKKAKSEDVQKVADNLLITAIAKRPGIMGIFDKEKKAFEVEYKDIPVSETALIQRELKKRGIIPTENKILELYIRSLSFKKG